ncbi:MAG: peptidoglycan-binding protein [Eubacteriales bacterium]|nr:peptidoglycan-binding protein [Eubacteriales bacterium]
MIKRLLAILLAICVFLGIILYSCNSALAAATSLKIGMSGSSVSALQKDLKTLGFFNYDEITGYFGEITEQAVISFQKKYKLDADGIAGAQTFEQIEKLLNSSEPAVKLTLKKGMEGSSVKKLQEDLITLGYLDCSATGYYGDLTVQAVMKIQKKYGLSADGIAGKNTYAVIENLLIGKEVEIIARDSENRSSGFTLQWSKGVENIFKRGTEATVYDIETGLGFMVKRNFGTNHADCEPLTQDDTDTMLLIYGGEWSWERRAVVVTVNGSVFAASMNGMPHAGLEAYPVGKYVNNRSGDFGYGYNYDAIKDNGMNGHFCIHFYGSMLHESAKTDSRHQEAIKKANEWLERNKDLIQPIEP